MTDDPVGTGVDPTPVAADAVREGAPGAVRPTAPTAFAAPASSVPPTRASLRAAREAASREGTVSNDSASRTGAGPSGQEPVTPAPTEVTAVTSVVGTVALALLVTVSAAVGPLQTGMALGLTGMVLAWGWPLLMAAPAPRWSSVVVGAGSVALGLTVGLTRDDPYLRWLPATIGVSLVLAFLQQVLRRDRTGLTLGLATTVAGLALATAGAPLVALPDYAGGPGHVAVAMAAVAASAVADLLAHLRAVRRWVLLPAVLAGVGASLLVAHLVGVVEPVPALVLGVLAGGVSHVVRRVLAPLPDAVGLPARLSVGAASVLAVGVLVYLATRLYIA